MAERHSLRSRYGARMRITSIEAYTYELGYRYGTYVMSGGRVVKTLTSTVVRIVTDEGIDGWAETCPLGVTYLPAHARGAIPAMHELAPALIGADPTNLGRHQPTDARSPDGSQLRQEPTRRRLLGHLRQGGRPTRSSISSEAGSPTTSRCTRQCRWAMPSRWSRSRSSNAATESITFS